MSELDVIPTLPIIPTLPTFIPKLLTLSISQIAPLIGLDNYNNFPKIFCEIWRKYNPEEFREYELLLLNENAGIKLVNSNEINDIQAIDSLIGTNIAQQINALNENKDKTSYDMVAKQNEITKYIKTQDKLNTTQKTELIKTICSVSNKKHGINNEDAIMKEFCRISEKTLKQEQGWVEIKLVLTDIIQWVIIGKYDGITSENELIEAKMRQKGLFKKMRDYENVQVQLYLHALEFKQGYLVENFTNKKNEMNIHIHEITYDAEYVNEIIIERLKHFTTFFENVMQDNINNSNNNKTYYNKKTILNGLFTGDKKRDIYNIYENVYLGLYDMSMD